MLCVSFRLDHIPGKPLPPFDFSHFAACSDMFTGHVLKQVPPELSATVSDIDWPAAGKSPRQLALDLGHLEIVELMDFVQFHAEGSSLVSHLKSTTTFVEGLFALAKSGASSFVQHIEAKSKCALRLVCIRQTFFGIVRAGLSYLRAMTPTCLRNTATLIVCFARPVQQGL